MKGKFPNGLAKALEESGVKAVDLAKAANTSAQQISRLKDGERKLDRKWAERLSPHIPKTSPADLVFASESRHAARAVPLGDLVSAGAFAEMPVRHQDDVENMRSVIEALPDGEWIAFDVVGDSMNLLAPEGTRIYVNQNEKDLIDGKLYVVALDDAATFKRYRAVPPRLQPESSNPQHEAFFFEDVRDARVVGRVRKVVKDFE